MCVSNTCGVSLYGYSYTQIKEIKVQRNILFSYFFSAVHWV